MNIESKRELFTLICSGDVAGIKKFLGDNASKAVV